MKEYSENAIICCGEYQLLNGLNIVSGLGRNTKFDLFLRDRVVIEFPDIVDRLKTLHLFNNIFVYKETFQSGKITRLHELINPYFYLKNAKFSGDIDCIKSYKTIYMGSPMTMEKAVCAINPNADVYWYDEGTGTYTFESVSYETTRVKRFLLHLIGRDITDLEPQKILLNNPIAYCGAYPDKVQKLPLDLNDNMEYRNTVKWLCSYPHNDLYKKKRVVILTQVGFTAKMYGEMCEIIDKFGNDVIIRKHPGENEFEVNGIASEKGEDLWELVCSDQITDKHILISINSTAAFLPKLIYDKEPYVFFLHRYHTEASGARGLAPMEAMIAKLENLYVDKHKIILPNSTKELMECLCDLVE